MKKKRRRIHEGFSLIELIIAIAILVILTGLLAPQFMKYIEKSREAKDMQTLDTIYTGVQGALTNEAACAAVKEYADIKTGVEISDIVAGSDAFGAEVRNLIGPGPFKLVSGLAIQVNGFAPGIYVAVSEDSGVFVYYGDAPVYVPGLTAGTLPEGVNINPYDPKP